VANDHIDITVEPGEVHALLGENGAGKSTLMNQLYGLLQPDEGEILVDGEAKVFRSPRDAIAAGIGMVHQHFMLVPVFTVAENLALGAEDVRGGPLGILDRRRNRREVLETSRKYGLPVDPDALVENLPVGAQQRVEIVKALTRDVDLLILDEPTAVLTPQEAEALFQTLRAMAAEGRTVIFISHKLHEVMAVSDRVTVLRGGRTIETLATADATPRKLAALMVGREVDLAARVEREVPPGSEAVLELEGVSVRGDRGEPALKDVSLSVRAGEIVGIAGVAGNGQRELAEVITGMRPASGGRVLVSGRRLRPGDPRSAIAARRGHVPEDRLGTGVASSLSIADNSVLKSYRRPPYSHGPLLSLGAIRNYAVELIRRYGVLTPGPDLRASSLSGGNLQKLVLGREFSGEPKVLVAASPTRGLDVGAIEGVHAYLRDAAAGGVALLLISEDLDEIMTLADRIVVLYEGRVMATVPAEGARVEELGLLMAGVAA
jgi:simple sugar transport system ATP-binding protein